MAKNEAKIKFTAETGQFNKEISKANSTMSELRAELRLNETQMKDTGATVEGLEQRHKLLEQQLEASRTKTEALDNKLESAIRNFGEGSTEVDKYRTQLVNAKNEQAKLEQAVSKCKTELDELKTASQDNRTATEKLTDTISDQQSELDQLKRKYADLVIEQKDNTDEAKDLANEIENLSRELKDSKDAFADASKKADDLDMSMESAGDSASASTDGFTVAKGVIADLAADAISAAIAKISEFISWLAELPEATRELRQDFATLETSFETAGFTMEEATNLWKDLYTVFGEDDRAVEAANLISKMCDNQEELNEWVTITQGIWGSYQDSLPVEGLAEASMETAKTGQVTGVLADALNWSSEAAEMFAGYMGEDCTTAEEAFNAALAECTTEEERQALITETLTALYGDAAAQYEEASGSQLAAKEATAENTLAQAELADAIEPVTTAWMELKTDALEAILPVIETVSGVMTDTLNWLKEHPVVLKILAAVVGVVAAALGALVIVVTAYTVAQWAMNAAVLACPITWIIVAIVAAVAALVAIIVLVIEYWDEIVAAVKTACEAVLGAIETAWEWIKGVFSSVAEWFNTNVIQPVAEFFTGLWDGIVNAATAAWDWICNAVSFAVELIGTIITTAIQIITLPWMFIWENCKEYVFAAWDWIKSTVSTAIQNVKAVVTTVLTAISNFFSTIWNAIKNVVLFVWNGIKSEITTTINIIKTVITTVWNAIKNTTTTVFNAVKNAVTNVWNAIKNAVTNVVNGVKNTVTNVWNSIKSTTSSVFNSVKSVVTSVWNGIKTAITTPIENAKNKVKSIVDTIKGFFSNMNISFPHIKLPHFSVSPAGWGIGDLLKGTIPSLSISWYKEGGIMTRPTIFGIAGSTLLAGGEAGPEAILPIDKLEGYITSAIEKTDRNMNFQTLANAIESLANRPVELKINDRQFAYATAGASDSVGGIRNTFRSRGLALE